MMMLAHREKRQYTRTQTGADTPTRRYTRTIEYVETKAQSRLQKRESHCERRNLRAKKRSSDTRPQTDADIHTHAYTRRHTQGCKKNVFYFSRRAGKRRRHKTRLAGEPLKLHSRSLCAQNGAGRERKKGESASSFSACFAFL